MSANRPWLQLHLSTAVALMFVAGGLLWLNVVYQCETKWVDGIKYDPDQPGVNCTYNSRTSKFIGWPFKPIIHRRIVRTIMRDSANPPWTYTIFWDYFPEDGYELPRLLADFLIALAILAVTAIYLEWRVRKYSM